jgi:hypothetical protein
MIQAGSLMRTAAMALSLGSGPQANCAVVRSMLNVTAGAVLSMLA